MDKEFTIPELDSYLNVTDKIINDLARKVSIDNGSLDLHERAEINYRIKRLHYCRKQIINIIEDKLHEAFSTEDSQ